MLLSILKKKVSALTFKYLFSKCPYRKWTCPCTPPPLHAHPALLSSQSRSTWMIGFSDNRTTDLPVFSAFDRGYVTRLAWLPLPPEITQLVRMDWELETRQCDYRRPCLLPCTCLSCVPAACPAQGLVNSMLTAIIALIDSFLVVSSF